MKNQNSNPEISAPGSSAGTAEGAGSPMVRPGVVPQWLALSFLVLALLAAAGIRFRLLDFPLERDEGEYAYAGQLILEGIPPYQLVYNTKMPGIYLAYAGIMALFGQTTAAIHLGLLIVNLATVWVLFLVARKFLDVSGAVMAAGAYALMTLSPAYLGLAAHATNFVVLPALLGVVTLFRMEKGGRWPVCLTAGGLFGVAFLMKQQGMFLGIFGGLYLAWISLATRLAWGRWWGRLAVYALGCLLPFFAVCLWLKIAGVFPAFWFWTFSYAREYVGVLTLHQGLGEAETALAGMLHAAPLLWAMMGAGLGCLLLTRQPRNARIFFGGFLFFSTLAVFPGFYFRQHYFIVFMPAAALLAGLAVSWSGQRLAQKGGAPGLAWLPFFLGVTACAQSLYAGRQVFFSLSPVQACRAVYDGNPFPESLEIARYLAQQTRKGERLLVVGSEPQIYFYAHRHSSSGYIYSLPLLQPQPFARTMQENMIREIEQNPPAYVVLVSNPLSWEVKPESNRRLSDWVAGYLNEGMEQVGLIQLLDTQQTQSIWGPESATAAINSDRFVAVFKRVESAGVGDRSRAIARNQLLMDKFNHCAIGETMAKYRAAIQLNPNDTDDREKLAFALLAQGQTNEASGEFQTILRANPDNFDAHANLGLILSNQGRINEATAHYREAVRLKPEDAIIRGNLGNLLLRQGLVDEAMSQFQEALRLQPNNARGHDDLGVVLALQGKAGEAISEFREALRLQPDLANAHDYLGAALALQGQNDEAILEFKEALRLRPDMVRAHDHLGLALASEGRNEEAIQQFQEALRLNPNDALARGNLAKAGALNNEMVVPASKSGEH